MKRLLIGILVVVLTIVVLGVGALLLVDVNHFRPRIQTTLGKALGREVTLGKLHVAVWAGSLDADDIRNQTIQTVSTRDFTSSLFASLLGGLQVNVNVAGLGIGVSSGLTGALNATLQTIAPTVDDLLYNLLGTLGIRLGQADVRVTGAVCGRAVLVQ